MDKLATHLKIALRMLTRRPCLTAGRLLTVTIVVTTVSAVFTVANATFLRPLPFPHADRLLRIYLQPPGTTDFNSANPLTPTEFERFRGRVTLLERCLKAVVAGAIVGIAMSIAAGTALAVFLPEVRGAAWTFAALCGCALVLVGAVAALVAARGVTSIEPLRALRAD